MDFPGDFDFDNPLFRANPYPAYQFLRDAAPIWRLPTGQWLVSTHAGCTAVLRDPRMGHNNTGIITPEIAAEPIVASLMRTMLLIDPPAHTPPAQPGHQGLHRPPRRGTAPPASKPSSTTSSMPSSMTAAWM
ncbi:MAG: hypothetical protein WDN04_06725 [Rhodospirillales bacterium]